MKKLAILISALFIAGSFTACTSETEDQSSIMPSPTATVTPEPSESPEISDDIMDESYGSLDGYFETVKETYADDYIPDMMIDETELETEFGLTKDIYEEVIAERSTLSENPDIFIAVKAVPDKAEEVQKCLEDYKASLLENNEYEANVDKIEASEIYINGDFVFMILLGANDFDNDMDMAENFKAESQKGVNALENMFTK
ncbi:MAG: DUF4358 domain-containing protein [Clostridia bacterium]